MITSSDITRQVQTYADAGGIATDAKAVAAVLIAAHDLTGPAPADSFDGLDEAEVAALVLAHEA